MAIKQLKIIQANVFKLSNTVWTQIGKMMSSKAGNISKTLSQFPSYERHFPKGLNY